MSVIDDLLERNAGYAEGFDAGGLAAPPSLKLAVLTCMDARMDVLRILGLRAGDAHVIRNAGGLATEDAIRSLIISHRKLGTEEVMVIQHTGCGMLTLDGDEMKRQIMEHTGESPPFDLGVIPNLEQGVKDAVTAIRTSPFVQYSSVRGFIYDVETGSLKEVQSP